MSNKWLYMLSGGLGSGGVNNLMRRDWFVGWPLFFLGLAVYVVAEHRRQQ